MADDKVYKLVNAKSYAWSKDAVKLGITIVHGNGTETYSATWFKRSDIRMVTAQGVQSSFYTSRLALFRMQLDKGLAIKARSDSGLQKWPEDSVRAVA